jgi:hypothetical protein
VGGSHPVTLQLTTIGEKILQKCGYNSEDNVPTKVVWSMFDVGIIYTSGTINEPPNVTEGTDEIFHQLGVANRLSSEERNQLLRYLEEYTGPNTEQVESLQSDIQEKETESQERQPKDLQADLSRLSELHQTNKLKDHEYELLKSRVLDRESPTDSKQTTSGSSGLVECEWLSGKQITSLAEGYREQLPEDKYDDTPSSLTFKIDGAAVGLIALDSSPSFIHAFTFEEQEQEDRLRELIDKHSYEIHMDGTNTTHDQFIWVKFNVAPEGFSNEVEDKDILKEIDRFTEAIETIYDKYPSTVDWGRPD